MAAEDSLQLFRVLSSSSQAGSIGRAPSGTADDEAEDDNKQFLVLAVTGRVPAPDVLQEIKPVLRVKSLTGQSMGGTDELLRITVNRPPQCRPCPDFNYAVPAQPPASMRLSKRMNTRRPAPIETFQASSQRSSPRHATSPVRSRVSPSPVMTARTMASHIPPLDQSLHGVRGEESLPRASLDIVWREVQVALEGFVLPLRFLLECRSSIDGTLLCSSAPLNTADFVSANEAPKVQDVILCAPTGLHDDSVAEGQVGDIFLRNVAGTLDVRGKVLTASEAARRKAAWALCKEGKLFEETIDEQDDAGDTALMRAARGKRLMAARRLLTAGADAGVLNHAGVSAWQLASEHTTPLLPWLLASCAGGYDPLMAAASQGRLPEVCSIVEGGGDVAVDACNHQGHTALMLASMQGHIEVMRCLVFARACPDASCHQGFTPLMKAAALGRKQAARFLLEHKAAPDIVRGDGSTALLDASACGHAELVKVLLAFSADINARREDGASALMVAVVGGAVCHESVDVLIKAGADVNLPYEATHCTVAYLRSATKRGVPVDAASFRLPLGQGERGCTPLMCAAWNGFHYTADLLITHKADLDAQSSSGYTALLGATGNMHLPVVALLLQRGADVGVPDNDGISALDECARQDNTNQELENMLCAAAGIADMTIGSRRKFSSARLQVIQNAKSRARRKTQSRPNSMLSMSATTSQQASPRSTLGGVNGD